MYKMVLMTALGGGVGAASRYMVSVWATHRLGIHFPWGTLIVNVLGSLLMGVLVSAIAVRFSVSNEVRALLAIGFLGGFTTFSSFALDFVVLMERNAQWEAMVYFTTSVFLSIIALFAGLMITRTLLA